MDSLKIIGKLKGETDRDRTSLYLSKSIMEEFKQACGDIAVSRVIEELMRNFIDDYREKTSNQNPDIDKQ